MEKGKAWESIHILCKSTSTQKEFKDGMDFQGVFKDKYIWKVGDYSSLRWDIRGRDISELRINRVLRIRSFSIVIYRTDLVTVHYCLLSRQLSVDKHINNKSVTTEEMQWHLNNYTALLIFSFGYRNSNIPNSLKSLGFLLNMK